MHNQNQQFRLLLAADDDAEDNKMDYGAVKDIDNLDSGKTGSQMSLGESDHGSTTT